MKFFKAQEQQARQPFTRIARLLALALLLLTCRALPAQANGVNTTIGNGQVLTGTVSGAGIDTYSFVAPSGGSLQVNIGRVGAGPTPDFRLDLYNPSGTDVVGSYNHYSFMARELTVANGTWKVKISVWGGSGTVSYQVNVATLPGTPGIASSNAGGSLTPGVAVPGSIYRGDLNIFTFTGVGGATNKATLTIAGSSGVADTELFVFKPDGTSLSGNSGKNYTFSPTIATSGTYTVFLFQLVDGDNTLPYNITVSGAGAGMPAAAKADGDCIPCQGYPVTEVGGAAVGDPINTATGNLFEHVTDYTTSGQNPLQLTRYYNSLGYTRNLTPTLLGYNWRTNYDRYLLLASSVLVAAERPDGQAINFRCNVTAHTCTPDSDMDYSLSYSGSTWTLTDPDDTVETYSASGSLATLSSIKLRDGYTQTMNYTGGVLTSVSDSYSRSLSFTYTSGFLTGVTTPDSATLTYGYIAFTSSSLLQSVTYNTSPSTKLTYLYEDSVLPYTLTGITDENNKRYATWTHDGSNRTTSSALGGLGANQTSISYSSAGNTVTGPLGIADTYKFTTMQNLPKLTSISRAANGTVASASESIRYDSNGFLNSRTDWNGNNTSWVNNSHGLPTQIS